MASRTWVHTIDEPATAPATAADLAHAPGGAPHPGGGVRIPAVVAIGAGAVLGANARYLVGLAFAQRWDTTFPWHTMLVNVVGSFILGLYLTFVSERVTGRATTKLFFSTGFLGSFTTFSTFSDETVQLFQSGATGQALAYLGLTLGVGLLAASLGIVLARVVRIP